MLHLAVAAAAPLPMPLISQRYAMPDATLRESAAPAAMLRAARDARTVRSVLDISVLRHGA